MFFKCFDDMTDDELKLAVVQLDAAGFPSLAARAESVRASRLEAAQNPYEEEGRDECDGVEGRAA